MPPATALRGLFARGGEGSWVLGGRRALRRPIALDGEEVVASGGTEGAVSGLTRAGQQEGNDGSCRQRLGSGADLGFRLPAEQLVAQEEGHGCAGCEGNNLRANLGDGYGGDQNAFEARDEIGGRKEKREALEPYRQHRQGQGGSGKKQEGRPENLIDDLRFLGAVGDAGDDQPERGKGDNSQGNEEKNAAEVSPLVHVENPAGKGEFDSHGRQRQNVVGEDAGGEHGTRPNRRNAEAPQDALFAESHELDAQSPEAAHDGDGQNGGQDVRHRGDIAAGKEAQKQEQEDHRENQAGKDEGAIAQRQPHADLG